MSVTGRFASCFPVRGPGGGRGRHALHAVPLPTNTNARWGGAQPSILAQPPRPCYGLLPPFILTEAVEEPVVFFKFSLVLQLVCMVDSVLLHDTAPTHKS